jgi:hypothetical protein
MRAGDVPLRVVVRGPLTRVVREEPIRQLRERRTLRRPRRLGRRRFRLGPPRSASQVACPPGSACSPQSRASCDRRAFGTRFQGGRSGPSPLGVALGSPRSVIRSRHAGADGRRGGGGREASRFRGVRYRSRRPHGDYLIVRVGSDRARRRAIWPFSRLSLPSSHHFFMFLARSSVASACPCSAALRYQ